MKANATANVARNLWSYVIIFCGHFPDGALHFTEEELEDETRRLMDAAPRSFHELPLDPVLSVPVPFATGTETGASVESLDPRRVTQCALSRTCGVCGATLGRPLAFVGTPRELDRMAFHVPACHVPCAERLLAAHADVAEPVLGLDAPPAEWVLVTTASFEFVRPTRDDVDRRPVFEPNGILTSAPLVRRVG